MPTTHPYDLVIGLDRSDRKADLHLIDTRTGNAQKQTVATSPEALHAWLAQLRLDHPQERVAICLPSNNSITSRVPAAKGSSSNGWNASTKQCH